MSSNLPIAFFRQSEVDVWVGQTNDRGIAVFPVTGGTADPLSVSLTNNRSAHGWWVSTNYATFSPGGIWAGANSAGSIDANGQHNGNGAGLTNIPASGVIGTALTNVAASAASTNVPGTDQNGHQVTIPWSGLPAGGGGGGNASTNVAQAWPAAQTFTQPAYFTNNGTTASTVIASNLITTKTVQFGTGNNDVYLGPSGDTVVLGTSAGLPTGTLSVSNLNATGVFTGNGSGLTNYIQEGFTANFYSATVPSLTTVNIYCVANGTPGSFSSSQIYPSMFFTKQYGRTCTNFWFNWNNLTAVPTGTNVVVTWYTNTTPNGTTYVPMFSLSLSGPFSTGATYTNYSLSAGCYVAPWTRMCASITNSGVGTIANEYPSFGFQMY